MAYNFTVIQRVSDGKYLGTNGTFQTLDFTSNYTSVRFYYSDADDAQQFVDSYAPGDYRVVEYWVPGEPSSNRPKSNATLLNNFQGSLYRANSVTISDQSRDRISTGDNEFNIQASEHIESRAVGVYLVLSEEDLDTYGIRGAVIGERIRNASEPTKYYLQFIAWDGRNFYMASEANGMGGNSFQYEFVSLK